MPLSEMTGDVALGLGIAGAGSEQRIGAAVRGITLAMAIAGAVGGGVGSSWPCGQRWPSVSGSKTITFLRIMPGRGGVGLPLPVT
jgi:hypothetical protein